MLVLCCNLMHILLGTFLGVLMLDPMADLFLALLGASILFSMVVVLAYILNQRCMRVPFYCILTNICC
jgi:hypothetical protein